MIGSLAALRTSCRSCRESFERQGAPYVNKFQLRTLVANAPSAGHRLSTRKFPEPFLHQRARRLVENLPEFASPDCRAALGLSRECRISRFASPWQGTVVRISCAQPTRPAGRITSTTLRSIGPKSNWCESRSRRTIGLPRLHDIDCGNWSNSGREPHSIVMPCRVASRRLWMKYPRLTIVRHRENTMMRPLTIAAIALSSIMIVGLVGAQTGDLFIYAAKGQSQQQQDKDRYECHSWAVRQTGFDPTRPRTTNPPATSATEQTYRPSQPHVARGAGRGAALGAVGGAITGDAGKGAAAGAAMGGLAGAFRRRDERRQQSVQRQAEAQSSAAAQHNQQVMAYRRAMAACLEARGYTVK